MRGPEKSSERERNGALKGAGARGTFERFGDPESDDDLRSKL
jgi:hypothetical protein